MNRLATLALAAIAASIASQATAAPTSILFIGNSYTFGRTDGSLNPDGTLNLTNQVLTYNASNVRDLTRPQGPAVTSSNASTPKFSDVTGTNSYPLGLNNPATGVQGNSYSPHTQTITWGGTAGIFKQFTVQAGLSYDVALTTRNAASLRGHLLNTANSTNWDLRGNISSQKWDNVVLQEQSDEALAPRTATRDFAGRPLAASATLGSNYPSARAYVDLIEDWVHTGRVTLATGLTSVTSYNEQAMYIAQYGSVDACVAAGGTKRPTPTSAAGTCDNTTTRNLGVNANSNAAAKIYLQETWARPDLINPPGAKTLDPKTALATYDNSTPAASFFGSLEAMTSEMSAAMTSISDYAKADGSGGLAGVIPTGRAFLRAVQDGKATRDMYAPGALADGLIDLWFNDGTHPSKWGSYLSALTVFGSVTGLDPQSLGPNEIAARDLGISGADAYALQQVAAVSLGFAMVPVPEPGSWALMLGGLVATAAVARRRSGRRA